MLIVSLVAAWTVSLIGSANDSAEVQPLPPASAIVRLRDIKQSTARIALDTRKIRPELVACDIGISKELNEAPACRIPAATVIVGEGQPRPARLQEFTIIAVDMRIDEPPIQVIFPAGIRNVDVGFVAHLKSGRKNRPTQ